MDHPTYVDIIESGLQGDRVEVVRSDSRSLVATARLVGDTAIAHRFNGERDGYLPAMNVTLNSPQLRGTGATGLQVCGESNREFAIQLTPASRPDLRGQILPSHGVATAFETEPPVVLVDDRALRVGDLPATGEPVSGGLVRLVQHIHGRHSALPGTNLVEVWTTTTIHPTGKISLDAHLRVLADVIIGRVTYLAMGPAVGEVWDRVRTGMGTEVPNTADRYGTVTWLEAESNLNTCYLMTSSRHPDIAYGFQVLDGVSSLRQGRDRQYPQERRVFVEHRHAGSVKVYPRPIARGSTLRAGEELRWSAEWLYAPLPAAHDLSRWRSARR